jgi:flagellar motor protein MotB
MEQKGDEKDKRGKKAKSQGRASWLDADSGEPMIHRYTERLNTFLEAMADGKVEAKELEEQEERLVTLLKEIEPKLGDELHGEVTELLCELTAYNIMHTMFEVAEAQPRTKFRG